MHNLPDTIETEADERIWHDPYCFIPNEHAEATLTYIVNQLLKARDEMCGKAFSRRMMHESRHIIESAPSWNHVSVIPVYAKPGFKPSLFNRMLDFMNNSGFGLKSEFLHIPRLAFGDCIEYALRTNCPDVNTLQYDSLRDTPAPFGEFARKLFVRRVHKRNLEGFYLNYEELPKHAITFLLLKRCGFEYRLFENHVYIRYIDKREHFGAIRQLP